MRTPLLACTVFAMCGAEAAEISDNDASITVRGDTYRIIFSRSSGVLDIEIAGRDGGFESVVHKDGGTLWYGCNGPDGEYRTQHHRPSFTRSKHGDIEVLTSVCPVRPEDGVTHRATYAFFPKWIAVSSRLEAEKEPAHLSIVRVAPRFDVDIEKLPHYSCREHLGRRCCGPVAELGERDTYVGLNPWGRRGVRCRGFDPQRAYFGLYDPLSGRSIAFAYPFFDKMWKGKHIFLQLHTSKCNYWYTGFGRAADVGRDFIFCICCRLPGASGALDRELPGMFQKVEWLVAQGALPWARRGMDAKLDAIHRELRSIWGKAELSQQKTAKHRRTAWLSRYLWREALRHLDTGQFQQAIALAERALANARSQSR